MHLELIQAGLNTPYTILLPPFIDAPVLPEMDMTPLGRNLYQASHGEVVKV